MLLRVVDDLNLVRITVTPNEDDAPRVVDANRVKPLTVASQCLKAIAGRHLEIAQRGGIVQVEKFASRCASQFVGKAPNRFRGDVVEEVLGESISETLGWLIGRRASCKTRAGFSRLTLSLCPSPRLQSGVWTLSTRSAFPGPSARSFYNLHAACERWS